MELNDADLLEWLVDYCYKVEIQKLPTGIVAVSTQVNKHGDVLTVERQELGVAINKTATLLDADVLRSEKRRSPENGHVDS